MKAFAKSNYLNAWQKEGSGEAQAKLWADCMARVETTKLKELQAKAQANVDSEWKTQELRKFKATLEAEKAKWVKTRQGEMATKEDNIVRLQNALNGALKR